MPDEQKNASAPVTEDVGQRIVRRLQGEDGYDIFADRHPAEDCDRWLREYEEDRR